jgi:hypothetical protein
MGPPLPLPSIICEGGTALPLIGYIGLPLPAVFETWEFYSEDFELRADFPERYSSEHNYWIFSIPYNN